MKIQFALLLSIFFFCATSCKKENTKETYFEWNEITLKNLILPEIKPEFGWVTPTEVEDSIFSSGTLGIRVSFAYQLLDDIKEKVNILSTSTSEQRYQLKDKIQSINIYSIYDFNEWTPAGSDVTDYFRENWRMQLKPVGYNLEQIMGLNGEKDNFKNISTLDLYLQEEPTFNHNAQFRIEITFSSGKTLKATTNKVKITR